MNFRLTHIILFSIIALILASCNNDIFIRHEPDTPDVPKEWHTTLYGNGQFGTYFEVELSKLEYIDISFLNTDFELTVENEKTGMTSHYPQSSHIAIPAEELAAANLSGDAKGPYTTFKFEWNCTDGVMRLSSVTHWGDFPENISVSSVYADHVDKGLITIDPGSPAPATYRVCSIYYPDKASLSVKPYTEHEDIYTIFNNGPDIYHFSCIPADWFNGFVVFNFPLPPVASLTDDAVSVNIPFYSPEFEDEKPDVQKWFDWKYVIYKPGIVPFKPTEPSMTSIFTYEIPPYSTRDFSADISRFDIGVKAVLLLENVDTFEQIEIHGHVQVLQPYDCKIQVTEK